MAERRADVTANRKGGIGLTEVLKGQFLEDKMQGKIWKGEGWWQAGD